MDKILLIGAGGHARACVDVIEETNQFEIIGLIEKNDGLSIAKVPDYADNNHWMNLLQIDSKVYGEDRESLMKKLEKNGIQTRPVWKLNHEQRPYNNCQHYKMENAKKLVENSLCLPSSSNLTNENLNKIVSQLNG